LHSNIQNGPIDPLDTYIGGGRREEGKGREKGGEREKGGRR